MSAAITQIATVTSQAIRARGTRVFWPTAPMTPALTPELAVEYLRALSADIRAVAILTAAGEPLAGAADLAAAAGELLAAAPDAAELRVVTGDGTVDASRDERHAIVAVCGRLALPALIRFDLKVALAELAADLREAA